MGIGITTLKKENVKIKKVGPPRLRRKRGGPTLRVLSIYLNTTDVVVLLNPD